MILDFVQWTINTKHLKWQVICTPVDVSGQIYNLSSVLFICILILCTYEPSDVYKFLGWRRVSNGDSIRNPPLEERTEHGLYCEGCRVMQRRDGDKEGRERLLSQVSASLQSVGIWEGAEGKYEGLSIQMQAEHQGTEAQTTRGLSSQGF